MKKSYRIFTVLFVLAMTLVTGAVALAQSPYIVLSISHLDAVRGAAWNGAETQILSWANDGTLKLNNAADGAEIFNVKFNDSVHGAIWNNAETQILAWSGDSTARVIDATTGEVLATMTGNDAVNGAVYNNDESLILTWSNDGTARIWNASTGDQVALIQHTDAVRGAAFNGDNTKILTYAADGTITISDFDGTDVTTAVTMTNETGVLGAAWNPQFDRVLSWRDGSGDVVVWDTTTGQQVAVLSHAAQATGATWGTNLNRILTWSEDTSARIWQSGSAPILMGHDSPVQWAAFTADESQIITLAGSKITVWDATTGDQVQELDYGTVKPLGAVFSHAGTQLATWGDDGLVKVWDIKSGLLIVTFDPETLAGAVDGVVWNADDSTLMSWGADSQVHVWNFLIAPSF